MSKVGDILRLDRPVEMDLGDGPVVFVTGIVTAVTIMDGIEVLSVDWDAHKNPSEYALRLMRNPRMRLLKPSGKSYSFVGEAVGHWAEENERRRKEEKPS